MFSKVQVINFGLSKIGASRIERLTPPRSSLERYMSENYDHWKAVELTKRRWVFAMEDDYALAKVSDTEYGDRPFKYELPLDCLRPVRRKSVEWVQRGRFIRSAYDGLRISYIRNADEAEFDPLFVEVIACKVALESAEYVTQSNTKKSDIAALYADAVAEAGKANAFVIGPEDVTSDDDVYPFLTARY